MTHELNETQMQLQRAIGKFADKWCPPERVRSSDEAKEYPFDVYDALAKDGWLGLLAPKEYGGAGGGAVDVALVLEEISKRWMALGLIYHTATIFPLGIQLFGDDRQKDVYLRGVASGKLRFAFSLTEPESGSDAFALTTTAKIAGDEFIINGAKIFTSGADVADRIALAVRTNPNNKRRDGVSLILLDAKSPGVTIRTIDKLGLHGISLCHIYLDDVHVPRNDLLGPLDRGWEVALRTLEWERLSIGARCTGGCQAVLDDAVAYASQRMQFGRLIGKFQAVQHMIADMEIATQSARALTYQLARKMDAGIATAHDAAIVKVYASEAYVRVARLGTQVFGGYGYTMEFPLQRHYRDSKIFEIGGGTSQIQRNIIAKGLGL